VACTEGDDFQGVISKQARVGGSVPFRFHLPGGDYQVNGKKGLSGVGGSVPFRFHLPKGDYQVNGKKGLTTKQGFDFPRGWLATKGTARWGAKRTPPPKRPTHQKNQHTQKTNTPKKPTRHPNTTPKKPTHQKTQHTNTKMMKMSTARFLPCKNNYTERIFRRGGWGWWWWGWWWWWWKK